MAATVSPLPKTSTRLTFSCIRCAERKVKCDRQRPCSACTKHNAECVFNASKPPRRKQKRVKVQVLSDRLNQYEALLHKHGIDRSELPDFAAPLRYSSQKVPATARLDETQLQTPPFVEPETGHSSEFVHQANDQDHLKFVEK
jgi:hypothetical protein